MSTAQVTYRLKIYNYRSSSDEIRVFWRDMYKASNARNAEDNSQFERRCRRWSASPMNHHGSASLVDSGYSCYNERRADKLLVETKRSCQPPRLRGCQSLASWSGAFERGLRFVARHVLPRKDNRELSDIDAGFAGSCSWSVLRAPFYICRSSKQRLNNPLQLSIARLLRGSSCKFSFYRLFRENWEVGELHSGNWHISRSQSRKKVDVRSFLVIVQHWRFIRSTEAARYIQYKHKFWWKARGSWSTVLRIVLRITISRNDVWTQN